MEIPYILLQDRELLLHINMAHFAKIQEDGIVETVVVINNSDILDIEGNESEEVGIAFCRSLYGEGTNWVQTSYNENFRKNYASIGGIYDSGRDAFIPPKPFPSWTLNEDTCLWDPPIPKPDDDMSDRENFKVYAWSEEESNWILLPHDATWEV